MQMTSQNLIYHVELCLKEGYTHPSSALCRCTDDVGVHYQTTFKPNADCYVPA